MLFGELSGTLRVIFCGKSPEKFGSFSQVPCRNSLTVTMLTRLTFNRYVLEIFCPQILEIEIINKINFEFNPTYFVYKVGQK